MIIPPKPPVPKIRKHLSADPLYALLKKRFEAIPDHRPKCTHPLGDVLQSALALFSLKDPSLLAFDQRRSDGNLRSVFHIGQIPSDSQMRTVLDGVDPLQLRPAFNDVLRQLQRGKVLERFVFYKGAYLLALDGTGYFSSQAIHCDSCLEKKSKDGTITYQHQMLAAALVHPDHSEVFPLAPEPIQKQDGSTKNDCERNAAKRLLERIRAEHPYLNFIVLEDGLASNAPHILLLKSLNMPFLLGAKPGDHAALYAHVRAAYEDRMATLTGPINAAGVTWEISFVNGVPLNNSHPDLLVNYLHYAENDANGECLKCFSWVTDLPLIADDAPLLVRAGRARWKIENETFNTLKNQGYHYEHNYGHGQKNLTVVLAMLMMLAFLVDQVQQHCCPLFKAVRVKLGSKRLLWDNLRSHFRHFAFVSMRHLYLAILYDLGKEVPLPVPPESDTS